MKMSLVKLCLVSLVLLFGLIVQAQKPEIYPLWPQGAKESNGLPPETVNQNGDISGNRTAELLVYHPAKDKNNGLAVLICPGGAYSFLSMKNEGELFAKWLTARGITAVILKYRMPNQHDRIPFTDASRAIRWMRSRAEELEINPGKIGIAGFSAGGHLASTVATHFDTGKENATDRLERFSSRPDFALLFYPVISMTDALTHMGSRNELIGKKPSVALINKYSNELHVSSKTPPVFLLHSDDDSVVPSMNSVVFYQALKKNKVPSVLYIFDKGGHGWGLQSNFDYYQQWTLLLEKWLRRFN